MTVSLTFDLDMLQSRSMILQSKRSDFAKYELSERLSLLYCFMYMVKILLLNIHALRMQDWDAFKSSIRMMM